MIKLSEIRGRKYEKESFYHALWDSKKNLITKLVPRSEK